MAVRISAKYGNLLFGALLSTIQVAIISAAVAMIDSGYSAELPQRWLRGFTTAWPIAFPSVLIFAPLVRRIVARLTDTVGVSN